MREVRIVFLGPLRRPPGLGGQPRVVVDEGTTVEQLLSTLGYDGQEQSRVRVLVSGQPLARSAPLGEVEEVTLFLPLGGG